MSKDNMLLGFARGKVGDLVFYRRNGEQVTRARNAAPANPRTVRQSVQRSIMKTVSSAYSLFSPIADHSFEGIDGKTKNQSEFTLLNVAFLRNLIFSAPLDLDDSEAVLNSNLANFASKVVTNAVYNYYQLSSGSLTPLDVRFTANAPSLVFRSSGSGIPLEPTYQQFVDALGLLRGDQLTFIWVYGNDALDETAGLMMGMEYSRLILEPANGDMSTKLWTTGGAGEDNPINSPNPRNRGRVSLDATTDGLISFVPSFGVLGEEGDSKMGIAAAVILSRKIGDQWKRSTQYLIGRSSVEHSPYVWFLGDAVASFMDPPSSSNLYLNQAVDG